MPFSLWFKTTPLGPPYMELSAEEEGPSIRQRDFSIVHIAIDNKNGVCIAKQNTIELLLLLLLHADLPYTSCFVGFKE